MKTTGNIALRALSLLATGLLATAGVAHADTVYDIGTAVTGGVTFDAACDTLTNTTGITALDSTTLQFNDGSNFTNVDFATLGILSWDSGNAFIGDTTTTFDGANLSGIAVSFSGNNTPRDDSFVGTNFSGATINASGNQPFVDTGGVNLNNANFSGTTFNFTNQGAGAFGFNTFSGAAGQLAGADFTNSVWNFTGLTDGDADAFNIGPGSTSIADRALAADFSGADFSGVTDSGTFGEIIANLGLLDQGTAVGAFYDANTVLPTGVTTAQLDAAGWQFVTAANVPEPSSLVLLSAFGGSFLLRRRRRG